MDRHYIDSNKAWLITIDKELDLYNIPTLRKLFMDSIEEKKVDFILDCSLMTFIDSTGLGELASTMKTVKGYNGTITIRGLKKHIKKIFELTGLETIFIIEGDENE